MALKLKEGTALIFAIRQNPGGSYVIEQRIRVGSQERPREAKPMIATDEEDLWRKWLAFGDEQLARVGLEKTK